MQFRLPNLKTKFSQKGFTLIELLVVLGILGILAAALLASINPVEQIKKAQDTSLKNVTTTFVTASQQYYSTHNALPWSAVANGGANCYTGGTTLSGVSLTNLSSCVTTLVSEGELKQSFTNANNLSQAIVTNPNPQTGSAQDVVACFMPTSQSQQRDSNTKYTQTGAAGTSCLSQGGTNTCYWCAQ
jgi:prepilin-type N-terminal cleavage/methylation domain-containing protein